ncbi:MAG TPA: hypothetical protein VI168_07085 [Croceibacterium sp.]
MSGIVEFLAGFSGLTWLIGPQGESDKAREERRRRDYEAWAEKHGSKWDKK